MLIARKIAFRGRHTKQPAATEMYHARSLGVGNLSASWRSQPIFVIFENRVI